jgi:hypothetical protein
MERPSPSLPFENTRWARWELLWGVLDFLPCLVFLPLLEGATVFRSEGPFPGVVLPLIRRQFGDYRITGTRVRLPREEKSIIWADFMAD